VIKPIAIILKVVRHSGCLAPVDSPLLLSVLKAQRGVNEIGRVDGDRLTVDGHFKRLQNRGQRELAEGIRDAEIKVGISRDQKCALHLHVAVNDGRNAGGLKAKVCLGLAIALSGLNAVRV
jgi:hypothetical protein